MPGYADRAASYRMTADASVLGGQADGVFTSGGTQSNLMALLLARDNYCLKYLNGHSVQRLGLPVQAGRFRILLLAWPISACKKPHPSSVWGLMRLCRSTATRTTACRRLRCKPPSMTVAIWVTSPSPWWRHWHDRFWQYRPHCRSGAICRLEGLWLHADAAYGCGCSSRANIANLSPVSSSRLDHGGLPQILHAAGQLQCLSVKNRAHLACLTYHADYLNPLSQARRTRRTWSAKACRPPGASMP